MTEGMQAHSPADAAHQSQHPLSESLALQGWLALFSKTHLTGKIKMAGKLQHHAQIAPASIRANAVLLLTNVVACASAGTRKPACGACDKLSRHLHSWRHPHSRNSSLASARFAAVGCASSGATQGSAPPHVSNRVA